MNLPTYVVFTSRWSEQTYVAKGYLYDRRNVGRRFTEEWGAVPHAGEEVTTCVRRFGRPVKSNNQRPRRTHEHITGARVSPQNGHDVSGFGFAIQFP